MTFDIISAKRNRREFEVNEGPYKEGFEWGLCGLSGSEAPYKGNTKESLDWCRGWHAGRAASRKLAKLNPKKAAE